MRAFLDQLIHPGRRVRIDPTTRYQTVEGWGTSLAWWGHVVGGWPDEARSAIADLVFSPRAGLGLNVARYNIGGGDDPGHHHMRPGGDVPGFQPAPDTWDWSADAGQRWAVQAARERGANLFEAFSNSPPFWMTRSGCAAGAADGSNNLRDDAVDAFAAYLAAVVARFRDDWGVVFRTVEPFNEPAASNWKSGNRQEGCHVSLDQQSAVIARLAEQLAARGLTETAISAADDYSIDQAVGTIGAYDAATLSRIAQVNTHSYSGTRGADLRDLATARGKRLWVSEYGTGVGPHDHEAMDSALRLSERIRTDMTTLRPVAWVYWQAVEDENGHNNWGLLHADFTRGSHLYWTTKQYFAMGQYCRFIRPGFTIVSCDDTNALAAYDEASATLVVVHENSTAQDAPAVLDLSGFSSVDGVAAAHRTAPGENLARLDDLPLSGRELRLAAPAQSITTYVLTARVT